MSAASAGQAGTMERDSVKDQADSYVTDDGRTIGPTVMEMKNITLRFGGVEAIKDLSLIHI